MPTRDDFYRVDEARAGSAAFEGMPGVTGGEGAKKSVLNTASESADMNAIREEIYSVLHEIQLGNVPGVSLDADSGGMTLLKSVHYPHWIIVWQAAGANPMTITQESHTVEFTDNALPKMCELSARLLIDLADPGTDATFSLQFEVSIDGTFAFETEFEVEVANGQTFYELRPWFHRFVFIKGRQAQNITAAESDTFFEKGEHTISITARISHINWTGIDIDVQLQQWTVNWYELGEDILTYDEDASSFDGT